jgi:hypothetical protein
LAKAGTSRYLAHPLEMGNGQSPDVQ